MKRIVPLAWLVTIMATLAVAPVASAYAESGFTYGPLSLCVGGYVFRVEADDAAVAHDVLGSIMVRSESFHTVSATRDSGTEERKHRSSRISIAGLGTIERSYVLRDAYFRAGIPGEAVWTEEAAHFEYLLPAVGDALPVRLTSPAFRGDARDERVLARLSRRTESTRCDVTPGSAGAEQWSPVLRPGPGYVREGSLGLPVRADESAQQVWTESDDDPAFWRIVGKTYSVAVFGWRDPRARNRPVGRLLELGWRIEPKANGATLFPPADYPRTADDNGLVYVTAFGLDGAALKAFLGRLEFLAPGDRRGKAAKKRQ